MIKGVKNGNSVITYLPLSHSKPVTFDFICISVEQERKVFFLFFGPYSEGRVKLNIAVIRTTE